MNDLTNEANFVPALPDLEIARKKLCLAPTDTPQHRADVVAQSSDLIDAAIGLNSLDGLKLAFKIAKWEEHLLDDTEAYDAVHANLSTKMDRFLATGYDVIKTMTDTPDTPHDQMVNAYDLLISAHHCKDRHTPSIEKNELIHPEYGQAFKSTVAQLTALKKVYVHDEADGVLVQQKSVEEDATPPNVPVTNQQIIFVNLRPQLSV